MYKNIGRKIKTLTEVIVIIEITLTVIAAVILAIALKAFWLFFVISIPGALLCYLGGFLLYGFGELIDKTAEIADNTAEIADNTAGLYYSDDNYRPAQEEGYDQPYDQEPVFKNMDVQSDDVAARQPAHTDPAAGENAV